MSNARKILLVSDDLTERAGWEKVLSDRGHAVAGVASAEDALWQLGQGPCDIVLTERVLRGMSGLELTGEVQALQAGLPVLVLTDAAPPPAASPGVTEYLRKPLAAGQIADAAERVLQSSPSVVDTTQTSVVETATVQKLPKPVRRLKNIILFLLAPFIGLFYLLTFPAVGIAMLAWAALRQKKKKAEEAGPLPPVLSVKRGLLKSIFMVPAVFVVGVFYAVIGPVLGIGVLVWFGFQAWGEAGAKAVGAGEA
jgi:CheY-like chemotaxis protein